MHFSYLTKRTFSCFIFLALLSLSASGQFYNGYEMQFGKNRVQYDERFWSFMKFKYFDTYYYLGGFEHASFTGRVADRDLAEIEKLFDYKLDGKIQFIIYNKLSEAKQTNIGLESDVQENNTGGVTRVVGNKVFIYFTGDHEKLHQQIREGIARVLIDQIMYGGDVKDRIQNSALLSLPDWYINGLISYVGSSWNVHIDNRVRDGIVTKKYLKFNRLSGLDAEYAGHSVWKYIVDTYTESAISNLLYMTRINRNIESGLMYVLGLDMKELAENWANAMKARYEDSDADRDSITSVSILKRSKAKFFYTQLKTSPDGRYSVYVSNDLGKYKVKLFDNEKRKTRRVLKGGFRSYVQETDVSFPVVAWHPSGQLIGIIRERKGKLFLGTYTVATKKYVEGPLFNFEKVLDFSYSQDGQSIVLSAVQKGRTDIYVYNLRTRTYEQITKDSYDDIHPAFIDDSRAIVFSSDRPGDSLNTSGLEKLLPGKGFDIFYYDYRGKSSVLRRITETDGIDETRPMQYDASGISYLSDANGIVNRYKAKLDSTLSFVDTVEHYRMIVDNSVITDYPRNILSHDINSSRNTVSEIIFSNNRYHLFVNKIDEEKDDSRTSIPKTLYRNEKKSVKDQKREIQPAPQTKPKPEPEPDSTETKGIPIDSNLINIDNYIFQSDFPVSKTKKEIKTEKPAELIAAMKKPGATETDSSGIKLPKQRNYETAFSSNYFVAQLDNSLLNQSYQIFAGGGAIFYNPGLTGFFKVGISDLMNDYKITGGIKLAGDLNSNEYFLSFDNLKKRFDKKITFYRQAISYPYSKLHSHELRFGGGWPFSDVSALRGSVAYRNDRIVILSGDNTTLNAPNEYLNWATGRLEYVFDNTLNTGVNLYNGTRLKFFGEYYKQVDRENSGIVVLGADIRHYQKIHRDVIWANRFATSTSFGEEKIIYYMGSTDNWISPEFNYETPIDYTQNYYFQALATNLRGFNQNIRNGNTFAVINSELRVPIFKYLLNRPIKSDFVRNFQIIGFGDVGTAWNGDSPYDSSNALNKKVYYQQPFTVTIISQNDPIVGGFGFGLRSRLLGYFLRADWAWGVQNREVLPSKFYFSLGLDF
jgi:hypothetical protein